jgi:hypothetical protein
VDLQSNSDNNKELYKAYMGLGKNFMELAAQAPPLSASSLVVF